MSSFRLIVLPPSSYARKLTGNPRIRQYTRGRLDVGFCYVIGESGGHPGGHGAGPGRFTWQERRSAFSVSKSQEPAVKKYIAGQGEHHKKEDFKSELLRLLRAHGIEFDERYVFD